MMPKKKVIDLGWCPRCKGDFYDSDVNEGDQKPGELATTRILYGIRWCRMCSFDLEESRIQKQQWVRFAKDRAEMEGLI